jgi:uncharacterized membrane protein
MPRNSLRGYDLNPLDIAKKRYAMGEIDSETFNKMKKELE